jgi:hypothetical protein
MNLSASDMAAMGHGIHVCEHRAGISVPCSQPTARAHGCPTVRIINQISFETRAWGTSGGNDGRDNCFQTEMTELMCQLSLNAIVHYAQGCCEQRQALLHQALSNCTSFPGMGMN